MTNRCNAGGVYLGYIPWRKETRGEEKECQEWHFPMFYRLFGSVVKIENSDASKWFMVMSLTFSFAFILRARKRIFRISAIETGVIKVFSSVNWRCHSWLIKKHFINVSCLYYSRVFAGSCVHECYTNGGVLGGFSRLKRIIKDSNEKQPVSEY